MAHDIKGSMKRRFAGRAVALAELMTDVSPVLFLCDPDTKDRETAEACPLSGEPGRVAVLAMTFCNPLALEAAATIEGVKA